MYLSTYPPTQVFTFEYLEPYSNGSCADYHNCLHCLTDSECGWCELTSTCKPRSKLEEETCSVNKTWQYLVLQSSNCPNCSNYVTCQSCLESGLCVWSKEGGACERVGRGREAVEEAAECPVACHERTSCGTCLDERDRCVWCQTTQKCYRYVKFM